MNNLWIRWELQMFLMEPIITYFCKSFIIRLAVGRREGTKTCHLNLCLLTLVLVSNYKITVLESYSRSF